VLSHAPAKCSAGGDGQFGQLPARAPKVDLPPVKIEGLPQVVDLALGGTSACARGVDGRVYCSGEAIGKAAHRTGLPVSDLRRWPPDGPAR
jgi:hypothetical protein